MEEHDKGGALPEEEAGLHHGRLAEMQAAAAERGRAEAGSFQQKGWGTRGTGLDKARASRAKNLAERPTWSRSMRALEVLRTAGESGFTAAQVARAMHDSLTLVETALRSLFRSRRINRDVDDDGVQTWIAPQRELKARRKKARLDNAAAAKFFCAWTISSMCSRKKSGIEIDHSYPLVRIRSEESSSSPTSHHTSSASTPTESSALTSAT